MSVAVKRDPWLNNRDSLRIVQRVRLPGFIAIRAPLEGKVKDYWVRGGTTRDQSGHGRVTDLLHALASDRRRVMTLLSRFTAAKVISRFRAQISPGERVGHGHRLGFVYFATAISIYLPCETRTELECQNSLLGGATNIGVLTRPEHVVRLIVCRLRSKIPANVGSLR